ncbi:MAG: hypothetical protein U5L45_22385 [Saprospiraceae bacterium]|nr:hypothetical protein [Saprospiraceae bacterium]
MKPGGIIAVVDFHQTPVGLYRRFMRNNHVEIKRRNLPFLHQHFNPKVSSSLWWHLAIFLFYVKLI